MATATVQYAPHFVCLFLLSSSFVYLDHIRIRMIYNIYFLRLNLFTIILINFVVALHSCAYIQWTHCSIHIIQFILHIYYLNPLLCNGTYTHHTYIFQILLKAKLDWSTYSHVFIKGQEAYSWKPVESIIFLEKRN